MSRVVPDWPCTSMKPGLTTLPAASITAVARRRGQIADRDDAIAVDPDVGPARRRTAAVEHLAAADEQVELRRRRTTAGQGRRQPTTIASRCVRSSASRRLALPSMPTARADYTAPRRRRGHACRLPPPARSRSAPPASSTSTSMRASARSSQRAGSHDAARPAARDSRRRSALGDVWVKDETSRFGLPAFKSLGVEFAVHALGRRAASSRGGRRWSAPAPAITAGRWRAPRARPACARDDLPRRATSPTRASPPSPRKAPQSFASLAPTTTPCAARRRMPRPPADWSCPTRRGTATHDDPARHHARLHPADGRGRGAWAGDGPPDVMHRAGRRRRTARRGGELVGVDLRASTGRGSSAVEPDPRGLRASVGARGPADRDRRPLTTVMAGPSLRRGLAAGVRRPCAAGRRLPRHRRRLDLRRRCAGWRIRAAATRRWRSAPRVPPASAALARPAARTPRWRASARLGLTPTSRVLGHRHRRRHRTGPVAGDDEQRNPRESPRAASR